MLASAGATAELSLLQPEFDADAFWAPWPTKQPVLLQQEAEAAAAASSRASLPAQPEDGAPAQPADFITAGTEDAEAATAEAATAEAASCQVSPATSNTGAVAGARAEVQQVPEPAAEAHQEAVQLLQQALSEALACQQLATARSAALALVRCYGLLQPQRAGEYLAVAQDCKSVADMKAVFERCECVHYGMVSDKAL
jgi:hypothetical protein